MFINIQFFCSGKKTKQIVRWKFKRKQKQNTQYNSFINNKQYGFFFVYFDARLTEKYLQINMSKTTKKTEKFG
jgi:hypothetical protein